MHMVSWVLCFIAVISQCLIHANYLSISFRVVLMTQWWMQIYFYIFLKAKSLFYHLQCQDTKLLKAPQFIPIDQQLYNTSPRNPESKQWSTSDTLLDQLRTNHGIVPHWTLPILYQLLCWFQWISHRDSYHVLNTHLSLWDIYSIFHKLSTQFCCFVLLWSICGIYFVWFISIHKIMKFPQCKWGNHDVHG